MSDDSIPTRLAVLEAKTDRTERDVQSLATQVVILTDKMSRGFETLSEKLDKTNGEWFRSLNEHIAADAEADAKIMKTSESTNAWIKGAIVGAGIIIPVITVLEHLGFLRHL